MILFSVMGFVEYQEADLINTYERMHETLIQYLRGTDDYHILFQVRLPCRLCPEIGVHVSTEAFDRLVQVGRKNLILLEDQCHGIHLAYVSGLYRDASKKIPLYQKECCTGLLAH